MATILQETTDGLRFSNEVEEFILDRNMQLKAVKLKDGSTIDHERLHRHHNPQHPLIKTPTGLKSVLDMFFLEEFRQRRITFS